MLCGMETRPVSSHRTPQQGDPQVQRRLWDLAQDASRYLRRHASPAVRVATALLLAASLAACNASASDTTVVQSETVAPLAEEVASGLPRGPGSYAVEPGSVFRDQRGVYQFEWFDAGVQPGTGTGHVAHVSRLRLQRDERLELETLVGEDPVLHLTEGEPVGLIQQAQVGAVQPGPQYRQPAYSMWEPFVIGMLLSGRSGYYDPPRTVIVQNDPGQLGSGGATTAPRVSGGSVSETAKPPAQRVTGVQTAVGGRAGGTGAGSAVSSRNATGGTSSGSGVTAPRSGGFSGGTGSSGGSSAS